MWFGMKNITEDNIHGVLINHPFFIEHMTEGISYNLDFEPLTDWFIYAGDEVIKPSNLYLFFE